MKPRVFLLAAVFLLFAAAPAALAQPHGPDAPDGAFPSHVFQLAPREPPRVQLAFHYGLVQPILFGGFNAAVDVRYRRFILTYSHGQGLDDSSILTDAQRAAGLKLLLPYTTGGGVGILLADELWALADFKVHHFEASVGADREGYTTITVGGELGWRFFVWKGFNVALVARYWPNVWSSAKNGVVLHDAQGHAFSLEPAQQGFSGFFGNVLVGWAFNL